MSVAAAAAASDGAAPSSSGGGASTATSTSAPAVGSNECTDVSHKCFRGIARCAASAGEDTSETTGISTSGPEDGAYAVTDSTDYASELASNLHVMVDMGANFDHPEDCSLGDWGLCYTQTLTLEYTGATAYLDE